MKPEEKKEMAVRHFHIPDLPHLPAATLIAYKTEEFLDSGISEWIVSWAVCSSNDNFCRKTGREVALQKAAERGLKIFVDSNDEWYTKVLDEALNVIMNAYSLSADREVARVRTVLSLVMEVFRQEEMESKTLVGRMFERLSSVFLKHPMK